MTGEARAGEPRTEAGRELYERLGNVGAGMGWVGVGILAIEREAAAPSLDMCECGNGCVMPHQHRHHEAAAPSLDGLTRMVKEELHRVQCMNAKHRSAFTGQCLSAANVARGLYARLASEKAP